MKRETVAGRGASGAGARGLAARGPIGRGLGRLSPCPKSNRIRLPCLALLLGAVVALAGCGYTTRELFPTQYHSVAAPIFANDTFERGIEFRVSEALTKQIQARTPYKVTSAGTADTLIQGTITSVDRHVLSRVREGGVPQQIELTVRANFIWKDLRSGEVIRQQRGLEAVGRYIPAAPVHQRAGLGEATAAQNLAGAIVDAMRGDW